MLRSLISSVSNTAATSSHGNGNGTDTSNIKNETHLSVDMTNNHNVNNVVVSAVVETIENDDDDSGVMLEARMNGDGRYYQEQDIRNNNDEQELLLVGKVLCYDNLMTVASPNSTTSINHQHYDDPLLTGMENNNEDDQLTFHPDEVNSLLLAEFGISDNSPISFGNKKTINMIDSNDPLLWDNESRLHHQNVEEITPVLPDTIDYMMNNNKMMTTTVEYLMMKKVEMDDEQQHHQERNVVSDHQQYQPSSPSSNLNIEEMIEMMEMMTMTNNNKVKKMKDIDGMNNTTNHQQGVHRQQELLAPKTTKKNHWWFVIPTSLSDESYNWNHFIIYAYIIIIVVVVIVITCFIDELSKQKTMLKTTMSPTTPLPHVEEYMTMNASSIFQSDHNSVVNIPATAIIIKNNEGQQKPNDWTKSTIWSDVATIVPPSSSNNKIDSTTIIIPTTRSMTADNNNTTVQTTTKTHTTAATGTCSNDHYQHGVQSKQSQPPHYSNSVWWWLPKSMTHFINYLWMKLIQPIVRFGMVLLVYMFRNWYRRFTSIKSSITNNTVATTPTQTDNVVSDNSSIISNIPDRHVEQNQSVHVNRVYNFHKYNDLLDFMKQSNALLQRSGHTPKKSCTLESCALKHFVNRGMHVNDLNIASYNRLSKDELILLIKYFDIHHHGSNNNHTIMMSPFKKDEKKATLQLKLITWYHEVLVTLSNKKLNELIIVKLQNCNIDNDGTTNNYIRQLSSIVVGSPTIRPDDIMSSPNSTVTSSDGENNTITRPNDIMSSPTTTPVNERRRSRLTINIDHRNEMIRLLLEIGF